MCAVDKAGQLVLPAFVRATLARRGADRELTIGAGVTLARETMGRLASTSAMPSP